MWFPAELRIDDTNCLLTRAVYDIVDDADVLQDKGLGNLFKRIRQLPDALNSPAKYRKQFYSWRQRLTKQDQLDEKGYAEEKYTEVKKRGVAHVME